MMLGGIYRGRCTNVSDPEGLYRIKVEIPTIYGQGNESDWAWPCVPPGWFDDLLSNHVFTDNNDGTGASGNATETLIHALRQDTPKVGEPVWVMFEAGDADRPVWMGQWQVTGG